MCVSGPHFTDIVVVVVSEKGFCAYSVIRARYFQTIRSQILVSIFDD